jgi:hypothetical protein
VLVVLKALIIYANDEVHFVDCRLWVVDGISRPQVTCPVGSQSVEVLVLDNDHVSLHLSVFKNNKNSSNDCKVAPLSQISSNIYPISTISCSKAVNFGAVRCFCVPEIFSIVNGSRLGSRLTLLKL